MTNHPEYPKINSPYKRDEKGKFLFDQFSCPEFDYLWDVPWQWTEKVDGTNVRVGLTIAQNDEATHHHVSTVFMGRTEKAQMPTSLLTALTERFINSDMQQRIIDTFVDDTTIFPYHLTLYGEGYGKGIQKAGSAYSPTGVDFILFDIRVGNWWLKREAVVDIGAKLHIPTVPVLVTRTPLEMESYIQWGDNRSAWPNVEREGVVGTPVPGLLDRSGKRIMVKMKKVDYAR